MKSDVTSKGFLLKRQTTNGTCGHLWSHPKVIEQMIDEGFVIFKLLFFTKQTGKVLQGLSL